MILPAYPCTIERALSKTSYATPTLGCHILNVGGFTSLRLFQFTCSYRTPKRTVRRDIGFHSSCAKYAYSLESTVCAGLETERLMRRGMLADGFSSMKPAHVAPDGKPNCGEQKLGS